jgi:ABC-type polysaccharide/polyol phosphate transport system ATPase subunit
MIPKNAVPSTTGFSPRKKDEGDKANIFVLATHNEKFMKRMCNCVLDLDTGAIKSL